MKKIALYSGYLISEDSKKELISIFPPKYDRVIAHHITTEFGSESVEPPATDDVYVVGYADSGDGIECVVVQVNGTTVRQKDNSTYHITMSLDSKSNRKPFDSNTIIKNNGYITLDKKIKINVKPFVFETFK